MKIDFIYPVSETDELKLPIFLERLSAGFPSPAEDYMETELDLNRYLVKNPNATFFVRVSGDSMQGAGIHSGDILVVDRSLEPAFEKVVIAVVNGELMVKRLRKISGSVYLYPENDTYKPLAITSDMDFYVWGTVTSVIHPV
jgi:DNA polymerase V